LSLCGFSILAAQQDTLHFSFTNGLGKRGMTYAYPLMVTDSLTAADSLFAGEMTILHNGTIFDIVGIQKTGTLLENAADVQYNPVTQKLSFAHTQPITGKGIFIDLLVTIKPGASGTTTTSLQNILLNEGNILGLISNGSMRPMDIFINPKNPPQDRIVGDTVQFTATGDVHLPVTWSVGDTHVVSIDGTGRVVGKNIGQTTITVTDDLGLTDQSLLLPIHPATLRSLTLSVPDMTVMQNLTFLLPIKVSTVTGLGITSAQFRLSYSTSNLIPLGVVTAGSMTAAWTEPTVLYGSNYLDVAMAGTQPLADSGTFVFVKFKVKRFASFSSGVNLSNVLFNENLNATIKNGIFTPQPGPVISLGGKPSDLIPGESASLVVSGGTAPYRWKMLSDTSIAMIDSVSGVLIAKQRGMAVFSAVDVNGFDGIDSVKVTDVRFTFPDASFIYTDSIDYPVLISSTNGLGIISAQLTLQYDTSRLQFVTVIRGGTATGGMLMELKDSAGLRFAFSSAAPLNGAGQFFVLRFKSKGLASIGHMQPMFFSQTMLNEFGTSIRTASQRFGSLAVKDVPNYAPVFTAKLRDTTISENQPLQFQLKASDANNDTLVFHLFTSSPGMTMTNSGLFTWRPNYNQAGTHNVVYEVGDYRPNGVTRDSAVITVLNVNRMPLFTREFQDTTIYTSLPFTFDFDALDPDGSPVTFGLLNERPGMKIDSVSGIFTWTPLFAQTGIHDIVIRVFDGMGGIAVREVLITVKPSNTPPQFIHFFTDTTIQEDQLLTYTLKASDAENDAVHYYIQNIQTGMTIDTNSGVFTWRPAFTQAGTYNIAFIANDGMGGFANTPAVIKVLNTNRLPQFTRAFLDTIIGAGSALIFDFNGIDPDGGPVTFGLLNAPQGMAIDSVTGVMSWTPSAAQAGIHDVVVRLFDQDGGIAVREVLITVKPSNTPPQFTRFFTDTTIQEDQLLTYTLKASDAENDTVHYYIQNIQTGMTIDTNSGVITWRPTYIQAGTYNIAFIANDGRGGFANTPAVITVLNTNRSPFFTDQHPDTIVIVPGQTVSVQFTGEDPDNDPLIFSPVDIPAGSSLTEAGLFFWAPTASQAGMHQAVISLSDGNAVVRDSVIINVMTVNASPLFTHILPDTTIREGQLLTFRYTASDPDQDSIQWQLAGTPPAGVALSKDGVLNWLPGFEQSGTYTVVVSISDKQISVLDSAVITVINTNRSPRFTAALQDTVILADSLFTFTWKGTDDDRDSIFFSLVKGPSGSALSSAGVFTWRPSAVLKETVIVSLSDGGMTVRDSSILSVTGFPKVAVSVSEIDFGTTIYGSLPEKQVTVRNTGKIPLVLTRITGLPNEQHFAADAAAQIVIGPQKEQVITVTYTPQQIGSHTSGLAFQTNDPGQKYVGLMLKGTAISVAAVSRKLLVDLTHHPRTAVKDSLTGMTQLFGALKKSGVSVAFAETTFSLDGYDAVLIVSPSTAFTGEEKASLRQFVRDGGLAVMMENAGPDGNSTVINGLLRDTLIASGMMFQNTVIADSSHNYMGNPTMPMITQFADTNHPYLRGVDSLVFFGSGLVMTDSSAVPFAAVTAPSIGVQMEGYTASVIGVKKSGKGTIVVIGNTALWQNAPAENEQLPFYIAAKDNFTFALNIFSIEENYVFAMPEKTPSEVYQLISIPMDLKDAEILSVLKENLGEINPLKWRLFGKFDVAAERYREFPSAGFTSFTRGEAYWLITRGEFSLTFGSASVLPAQDFFPITIGPGYSMIGNPFPYPVSWKDSRIGDSVQTTLWRFDPAGNKFVPESLALAPFTGYFVKNVSRDSVTIYINPRNAGTSPQKRSTEPQLAEREWRVRIGAAAGKANDDENYAGVSAAANEELDRFDVGEPPTTPTDYLRVQFTNPQWTRHKGSYAVDIRPVNVEGVYWEFDVTAAKGQSRVRLTLDLAGVLPHDFGLYLVDKATERVTRFDRAGTYEFTMGKNQTRQQFRLVAGKQEYVEKNTNGIPLIAVAHQLEQNYPNPFNPSTFIHYTIGHSGIVQLEIYNVLGQKVRGLRNELQQIGSYNAEWDGKDDAGEAVASGVYFYKITVTNNNEKLFTETKKMVLMK
jgi:hypothetical protein